MNVDLAKECPHCSKRLAGALDHWAEQFKSRAVHDDFADEISELLSDQADAIRAQRFLEETKNEGL